MPVVDLPQEFGTDLSTLLQPQETQAKAELEPEAIAILKLATQRILPLALCALEGR